MQGVAFFMKSTAEFAKKKGERCEQDVTKRPSGMKDVIK
jgi:hypothetical protein